MVPNKRSISVFLLSIFVLTTIIPLLPVARSQPAAPTAASALSQKTDDLGYNIYKTTYFNIDGFVPVDQEIVNNINVMTYILGEYNSKSMIVGLDKDGDVTWSLILDVSYSPIAITVFGDYIYCTFANSTDSNGYDVVVMKISISLKSTLWTTNWGGSGNDVPTDIGIVNGTDDKGVFICGYTNSYGSGGYDIFLLRITATGAVAESVYHGTSNGEFAYAMDVWDLDEISYVRVAGGVISGTDINMTLTQFQYDANIGSTAEVSNTIYNISGYAAAYLRVSDENIFYSTSGKVYDVYDNNTIKWISDTLTYPLPSTVLDYRITFLMTAYIHIAVSHSSTYYFVLDQKTGRTLSGISGFGDYKLSPAIFPYIDMEAMDYGIKGVVYSTGTTKLIDIWKKLAYYGPITLNRNSPVLYLNISGRPDKNGTLSVGLNFNIDIDYAVLDTNGKLIAFGYGNDNISIPYNPNNNQFYLVIGDDTANDYGTAQGYIYLMDTGKVAYNYTNLSFMDSYQFYMYSEDLVFVKMTITADIGTVIVSYENTTTVLYGELYYGNGTLIKTYTGQDKIIALNLSGKESNVYYLVFKPKEGIDFEQTLSKMKLYYANIAEMMSSEEVPSFLKSGGINIPGFTILWLGAAVLLGIALILRKSYKK